MEIISCEKGDIFISGDSYEDLEETMISDQRENYIGGIFSDVFEGRENLRQYIDLYAEISELKGFAALVAHGGTEKNKWVFADGRKTKLVQNWIHAVDGDYACLLLWVCNPGYHTAYSSKSLILSPDREFRNFEVGYGGPIFSLYSPVHGEVDGYILDYCVADLKATGIEPLAKKTQREREFQFIMSLKTL